MRVLTHVPKLKKAGQIIYCHHEQWDGRGYPRGLAGRRIPLGARILAVVDVWDALQSERPYRRAWTRAETVQYLREQGGMQFDPVVSGKFLELVN
jgi:response regulator RpfG family c-di-GMP phosphodiesterase